MKRFKEPAPEYPLPTSEWITPSKINPWRGAKREGSRFTDWQYRAMARMGLDPLTVETVTVRSLVSQREMWWPTGTPNPVYVFDCPILGRRKDGRLLVLSPRGMEKLVWPDGSIRARKSRAKDRETAHG